MDGGKNAQGLTLGTHLSLHGLVDVDRSDNNSDDCAQALAGSGFAGFEQRIVMIPSTKGKSRAGRGPFVVSGLMRASEKKFLTPYYQNTKSEGK